MRTRLLSVLIGVLVTFTMSAQTRPLKRKPASQQGICGTVVEKKGDFMPRVDSPGSDKPMPKGQPVAREVVIYPVLTMDQVKMTDDGFITDVPTIKPIRTVRSDKQGKFCVYKLPAGRYSLLVREPKGLYGSLFDGNGNINPETVRAGKVTRTTIEITYQAAF